MVSKKTFSTSKVVLKFALAGAFIAGSLVLPGLPRILRGRPLNYEDFFGEDEWEEFDQRRLRQKLKEMHKAKLVRVYQIGDEYVVRITKKGKQQLLRYNLDELVIDKPERWDGKWRIVAYDIPKASSRARDALRTTLKRLGFLQLQKSVYLYPYPCGEAVEFIRQLYNVGEHVVLLTVGYLESEEAYRQYFKI